MFKFRKKYKKICLALLLLGTMFFSIKQISLAIEYKTQLSVPIPVDCDRVPLPGEVDPKCYKTEIGGLVDIVTTMYRFAVGAGTFLAIIMIVIGGIQYTASEVVGSKEDAKKKIQNAIYGLILLAVSIPILKFINPQITLLNDSEIVEIGKIDSKYKEGVLPSLCDKPGACSPKGSISFSDTTAYQCDPISCRQKEIGPKDKYVPVNLCGSPSEQCTNKGQPIPGYPKIKEDNGVSQVIESQTCSSGCSIITSVDIKYINQCGKPQACAPGTRSAPYIVQKIENNYTVPDVCLTNYDFCDTDCIKIKKIDSLKYEGPDCEAFPNP